MGEEQVRKGGCRHKAILLPTTENEKIPSDDTPTRNDAQEKKVKKLISEPDYTIIAEQYLYDQLPLSF